MSSWTRLSQQMRTLSSRSSKMGSGVRYTLCCRAHDTRGHAGNFLDFARTFAGDGIVFLLHISSETRQILCCVRTDHGHPLPAFRLTESVLSIFHKRLLTELSTHFFQRNSKQIHLAPYHFSCLNSLINVTSLWRSNVFFVKAGQLLQFLNIYRYVEDTEIRTWQLTYTVKIECTLICNDRISFHLQVKQ